MVQAVVQTTVVGLQGNPVATTAPLTNQALVWSGSAWAPAGPYLGVAGGTLTGPLTLAANATASLQAVTFQQLQGYLPLGGGQISGTLTVTGNIFCGATLAVNQIGTNGAGTITLAQSVTGNGNAIFTDTVSVHSGSNNSFIMYDTNNTPFTWSISSQVGTIVFSNTSVYGAMKCDVPGNLTIGGALIQGSDETNKTAISPLTQGISLIRQLVPKSFAWTATPTVTHWGFIAQDVQSVIPDAVTQGSAPPTGGTGLLGLDFNAILAAVTFAVKQLDQRLTAVEAHDGITPPAGELA